ncbi:hypothetical protein OUZ56_031929 [Daphnia magna]|uniref:Uncharacterized protein n=1 Tax=Daphnia magna TaxID=35525 RepID=A0ABQ9ZVM5_9CRUS|nr:hypothetical protein OUZ56_031929 [Daphnia magna]
MGRARQTGSILVLVIMTKSRADNVSQWANGKVDKRQWVVEEEEGRADSKKLRPRFAPPSVAVEAGVASRPIRSEEPHHRHSNVQPHHSTIYSDSASEKRATAAIIPAHPLELVRLEIVFIIGWWQCDVALPFLLSHKGGKQQHTG